MKQSLSSQKREDEGMEKYGRMVSYKFIELYRALTETVAETDLLFLKRYSRSLTI
jgi:hypothetical protein